MKKSCLECGEEIIKPSNYSYKQWDKKKYCSNKCSTKNKKSIFKKGQEPWNKGTKGVMKPNKTSWIKNDKRLAGKKQTPEHIKNALMARGYPNDVITISREDKSEYRYFYSLKIKFGISKSDYNLMLKKQNGVCLICQKKDTRRLSVDHDHNTGEIRGLLCTKCNAVLGQVDDNIETLKKMIIYLTKQI
jgi:hypothetical protein